MNDTAPDSPSIPKKPGSLPSSPQARPRGNSASARVRPYSEAETVLAPETAPLPMSPPVSPRSRASIVREALVRVCRVGGSPTPQAFLGVVSESEEDGSDIEEADAGETVQPTPGSPPLSTTRSSRTTWWGRPASPHGRPRAQSPEVLLPKQDSPIDAEEIRTALPPTGGLRRSVSVDTLGGTHAVLLAQSVPVLRPKIDLEGRAPKPEKPLSAPTSPNAGRKRGHSVTRMVETVTRPFRKTRSGSHTDFLVQNRLPVLMGQDLDTTDVARQPRAEDPPDSGTHGSATDPPELGCTGTASLPCSPTADPPPSPPAAGPAPAAPGGAAPAMGGTTDGASSQRRSSAPAVPPVTDRVSRLGPPPSTAVSGLQVIPLLGILGLSILGGIFGAVYLLPAFGILVGWHIAVQFFCGFLPSVLLWLGIWKMGQQVSEVLERDHRGAEEESSLTGEASLQAGISAAQADFPCTPSYVLSTEPPVPAGESLSQPRRRSQAF